MADRTDGMKGRALIRQLSGMPPGVNPLNVPQPLKRTVCLAKGIVDTWDSFPSENNLAIALGKRRCNITAGDKPPARTGSTVPAAGISWSRTRENETIRRSHPDGNAFKKPSNEEK